MNKPTEEYHRKRRTPEEIAGLIRSGMVCACGTCLSEPVAISPERWDNG